MGTRRQAPTLGVYGFAVDGLDDPELHLLPADPEWPRLTIVRNGADPEIDPRPPGTVRVEPERAEIWMSAGDRIAIDRATLTVHISTQRALADRLVLHPCLGLPASIASYWMGRQALHGGAFCHDGRAFALMGEREAGKSSTLGWLLGQGHQILSDDILIADRGTVFAGPRSVDLRDDAAAVLGGEDLGVVGNRTRWRLDPGAVPAATPLAGIVHLEWGDDVRIERLGSAESLPSLLKNFVVRPKRGESLAYLELGSLPAWRFTRPRDLSRIDELNAQLLAALG
jgi:hypothetical protein